MGWISVKEGVPVEQGVYIIFAPSADPDAPLCMSAWWLMPEGRWSLIDYWAKAITHWRPMPPPPCE